MRVSPEYGRLRDEGLAPAPSRLQLSAGGQSRIPASGATAGRMPTAGLLHELIWKRRRPQAEAVLTTASLRLGDAAPLPSGSFVGMKI